MLLSSEIPSVIFALTKFREGYATDGVDSMLAAARTALDSWERGERPALTAADVVNSRFQPTKFRQGYDQDQVDDFLDTVVQSLRFYEER